MLEGSLSVEKLAGPEPGSTTLRLSGPLLLSNLFAFRDTLKNNEAQLVVVDLTNVPYIDSAGLGALINGYVSRQHRGRRIAFIGPSERVVAVMKTARVDTVLPIFPSVDQVSGRA